MESEKYNMLVNKKKETDSQIQRTACGHHWGAGEGHYKGGGGRRTKYWV